jgi:hypothetical protein
VYASVVDGKTLTFFVSGKLWGRSLVMGDTETGSDWSHILGRSMAGPLEGKTLEMIPSVMTNWRSWLEKHPDTTATMIESTAGRFATEMLHSGREFGLGLVHDGKARFWRFDFLQQQPLVSDTLGKLDLVVHFDVANRTPVAWNRKTQQELLIFQSTAQGVQDVQTKSMWDLQRGVAIEGPLKGTRLKAVPAIVSFTKAWGRFHPDSTHWEPKVE